MSSSLRIAMFVESSRNFGRGLIAGVVSFAKEQPDWQLSYREFSLGEWNSAWTSQGRFDGIIARITSEAMARDLLATAVPVVDMLGEFHHEKIPRVGCDNDAIGRLAARHLIESGFSHIAYCGYEGAMYSDLRQKAVEAETSPVHVYHGLRSRQPSDLATREAWENQRGNRLAEWLSSLPKPLGVICANDVRALDVSHAARDAGWRIPGEIAVIGVDDDDLLCSMARPANSSVKPDLHGQGRLAAETLACLMAGGEVPRLEQQLTPLGVVERPSTDHVVTPHPHVAAAFRYARANLSAPLGIDEIARACGVSRSLLDRDFKQDLGRTVGDEIRRLREARIRHLLGHTDHRLEEIASLTGLSGRVALANFFKERTGLTPGEYRKARRASSGMLPPHGPGIVGK